MKVIMQAAGKAALRNGGGSAEAPFPAGGRQSAVSECEPATVPFGPLYSSSRRQQIFLSSKLSGKGRSQASGCFRTPGHQMLLSRDEIRISGALNTHGFPEVSNR